MDIMAKTLRFVTPRRIFDNRRFPLDEWKERMRDARIKPQIAAETIAQAVVEMVPRRQSSLLEVDQNGRLAEVKSWFGSSMDMVVSDTTLCRSVSGFAMGGFSRFCSDAGGQACGYCCWLPYERGPGS
jgi:hypothetical protein